MCGIAGVVGDGAGSWAREALSAGLDAMIHRGPDDVGTFLGPDVALGMRRLSIIDVAGGHQPLTTDGSAATIVMNGEVYNYVELRQGLESGGRLPRTRSDTEVVALLYEEAPESFVEALRGMFAFAIWDPRRRRLVLGRDRFGKKPLWTARTPRGLAFASELKALLPLLGAIGLPIEIDPQAVYDYLSLGCVPQPSCIYRNVSMLPPGTVAQLEGGVLKTRRYWAPSFVAKDSRPRPRLLEDVRSAIGTAVRIRLRSDVPVGLFLSGGIDSSVVALEAASTSAGGLRAFTVRVRDEALDESETAARTARALGLPLEEIELAYEPEELVRFVADHYGQPFSDSSAIPSVAISRAAAKSVKVVLNGDGGDEVFGGYRRYVGARWQSGGLATAALRILARTSGAIPMSEPGRRTARGFFRRWKRVYDAERGEWYLVSTTDGLLEGTKRDLWTGGDVRSTEAWLSDLTPTGVGRADALNAMDLEVNLLSDLLVKMDMASMSASLEARSPFLDQDVAALGFAIPERERIGLLETKPILREAYRHRLPKEVTAAPKRGFEVPLTAWLEGPLRPLVDWALSDRASPLRDWLRPQGLTALATGAPVAWGNRSTILYQLLVLALWLDGDGARRRASNASEERTPSADHVATSEPTRSAAARTG